MKITIGKLKGIIRRAILEAGGGTSLAKGPMIRDAMGPDFSDREQLGRISAKDADEEDELAPHLREPNYKEDDCWGPVPPTQENPYMTGDPYVKDYQPMSTARMKR